MKATINGIEVEGTPKELAEYQVLMDDIRRNGIFIMPPLGKAPAWLFAETAQCACGKCEY